jgi:hypothetical protein
MKLRWNKRIKNPTPWDKWMTRNFMFVFIVYLFPYDRWQFLFVLFAYFNYKWLSNQEMEWEKENDKCYRCGK